MKRGPGYLPTPDPFTAIVMVAVLILLVGMFGCVAVRSAAPGCVP